MSRFLIYALYHPTSPHVYIGKSSAGMKRPEEHSREHVLRRYANLPRSKWIQSLKAEGLEPQIMVLETFETPNDLNSAEQIFILACKDAGISLLNLTDGGDGVLGHKFTPEAIAKMSAKRKWRVENIPGERERLRGLSNSYWSNEEAREKKRQERLGKTWSEETKAKISVAHKGRKKSPEVRANMRAAAKLRSADPVWRAKQRGTNWKKSVARNGGAK